MRHLLFLIFVLYAPVSHGKEPLPLPRFVSLRVSEANLRTGPGTQYPTEWIYVRRDIPLEITEEFEGWRKIRDWDGSEGWVYRGALSGKRTVLTVGEGGNLLSAPDARAERIAAVEPKVVGKLLKCPQKIPFCLVEFESVKGWISRSALFGVYKDETVD